MSEQRCPHGFLRSVIPCAACGIPKKEPKPARPRNSGLEHPGFVDMAGKTIAGCLIESRLANVDGNACWRCVCACGEKFVAQGIRIRDTEKRGATLRCDACKEQGRKPTASVAPEQRFGAQDLERGIVERWWRIEMDTDGRMVKAEPVEAVGQNGLGVLYVLAFDIQAAKKAAFNTYCALRNKIRRARYHSEGKCGCGRARDIEGNRKCSECIRQRHRSKDRANAKKRGEPVEVLDKTETYRKRRETERQELRLEVLREVREQATSLPPRAFYRWLDEQLQPASAPNQVRSA